MVSCLWKRTASQCNFLANKLIKVSNTICSKIYVFHWSLSTLWRPQSLKASVSLQLITFSLANKHVDMVLNLGSGYCPVPRVWSMPLRKGLVDVNELPDSPGWWLLKGPSHRAKLSEYRKEVLFSWRACERFKKRIGRWTDYFEWKLKKLS